MNKTKRIVSIQDISCLGKCSLTVALPVISAMGIECSIIPTSVLSTHTAFDGFTFKDLTDEIEPIANHWKEQGFKFDGIYTGYLGSKEQVEQVCKFFDEFKTKDNFIFVDPAMADNGKLYAGFDSGFPKEMAKVCAKADIIVPNLTEACLLTDTQYKEFYDKDYIEQLIDKLLELGCKKIIITGVSLNGMYGVLGYEDGEIFYYTHEKLNRSSHGTGDVFASACVGCLTNGKSLKEAVVTAVGFTLDSIKATMDDPDGCDYGVNFETVLKNIIQ